MQSVKDNNHLTFLDKPEIDLREVLGKVKSKFVGVVYHGADYVTKDTLDIARDIDSWHKQRGWDGIGYSFVVERTGAIYATFRIINNIQQSHCLGKITLNKKEHIINRDFIGVCFSGDGNKQEMTANQINFGRLLFSYLTNILGIDKLNFFPHAVLSAEKTCPGYLFQRNINGLI